MAGPGRSCRVYSEPGLIMGYLCALISTSVWLLVRPPPARYWSEVLGTKRMGFQFATCFKMPVSTTQSSVGAVVGFSVVLKGFKGIHWDKIATICEAPLGIVRCGWTDGRL